MQSLLLNQKEDSLSGNYREARRYGECHCGKYTVGESDLNVQGVKGA
jgi:hypothetical protein